MNDRGADLALAKWIPKGLRILDVTYKCVTYMHLTRSAAWHYLLGGMFPKGQQQALDALIDVLSLLHHVNSDIIETPSKQDRINDMKDLKAKVLMALILFEREFPKTVIVACFHNLLHMTDAIFRWNNVRNFWAFFMERYTT
jgi:hypothetical protein